MPTSCTVRSLLCTVCTLYNYLVNIDADVAMMPCANVQDPRALRGKLRPPEGRVQDGLQPREEGPGEQGDKDAAHHTKLRRSSARLPPEALQSVSHVLCHAFVCLYLNEIDNITTCSS